MIAPIMDVQPHDQWDLDGVLPWWLAAVPPGDLASAAPRHPLALSARRLPLLLLRIRITPRSASARRITAKHDNRETHRTP